MKAVHAASLAATLALALAGTAAQAAPVNYSFWSSASAYFGDPALAALLDEQPAVSGSFSYDAATPYLGQGRVPIGPNALYVAAFTGLNANVSGHSLDARQAFAYRITSLPATGVSVLALTTRYPLNVAGLPPSLQSQLAGFTLGDHTLTNVNLIWPGELDTPAPALPQQLPGQGLLQLIFTRTDTIGTEAPQTTSLSVDVQLQQVSSVPEPSAAMLALLGMCAVAAVRKRVATGRG